MRQVTLMFTDIEGSTRWWELAPDAMRLALERHDALLNGIVTETGGQVFKTVGDAICAVFPSHTQALEAAAAAQRAVTDEPWPDPIDLKIRVAVHSGPCHERAGDYFGPAVNRVARLESAAHGGQVVVSAAAAGAVPAGLGLLDLGWHRLKDLGEPEHVFQLQGPGLRSGFAPLRSLDRRGLHHNLPAAASTLVGRSSELADLHAACRAHRLVTIVGPGGAGKTRLALAVAEESVERRRDGVWFVDLAPVTSSEVLQATASVLGVRGATAEQLEVALADRDVVVVMDNCEHVIDEAAGLIARMLRAGPRLQVLATSREPLGIGGERVWRIPPLRESAELFMDRALAAGADLDAADDHDGRISRICRRLDGMPLAIELAAARSRTVGLAEIETLLDGRLRLLEGGGRDVSPRQRTLRASVDWSFDLLDSADQRVLCRLSVFADGFDLEAVQAIAALDRYDTVRAMDSLVAKSLVVAPDRGRYRLLETIKEYASERLALDPVERRATREAHRRHYAALARRAQEHLTGPVQHDWLGRLERELGNLRLALAASPHVERVQLISGLRRFWLAHDHQRELLKLLRELIDQDVPLPARALALAAEAALAADLDGQAAYAHAALDAAREAGDLGALAIALETLCSRAFLTGEGGARTLEAHQAVEVARRAGDPVLLSEALLYSSRVDVHSTASARWLAEALDLARAGGDRFVECRVLNDMGVRALSTGDVEAAERALTRGLSLSSDAAAPTLSINLAFVRWRAGQAAAAAALARTALVAPKRHPTDVAYAVLALALCEVEQRGSSVALTLLCCADRELGLAGEAWQEPERTFREQALARLRDHVGERWEDELARARGASRETALDLALGGRTGAPPRRPGTA